MTTYHGMEPCPICYGNGKTLAMPPQDCTTCGGAGQVFPRTRARVKTSNRGDLVGGAGAEGVRPPGQRVKA